MCKVACLAAATFGCMLVGVLASETQPASSFVLFDKIVTHRGDRQLHANWNFCERMPTHPTMPTNWLAPESPLFARGLYQFRVEVRAMERSWKSPMHVQFGWWNIANDPVIRHIAAPPLLLTNLSPPSPGEPWVYEQVGTIRSLDRKHMYYGAGPKKGKLAFDWDWHQAFAKNSAYTLLNPRDNDLDTDHDGKVSEAEFPDVEMRVTLTIHGPASPLARAEAEVSAQPNANAPFDLQILDTMMQGPWLKATGDLDGDGQMDLVIGAAEQGGLVAYHNRYPRWDRELVDATRTFSTDGEIADIDGDGRNDIVAIVLKPAMVAWYQNTPTGWHFHPIVTNTWHDVEVADFDGDGLPDLVGRNQKEWPAGKDDGRVLHLCWQERSHTNVSWVTSSLECPSGEGLLVTDLDGNGRPDIVVNQYWYENLGGRRWAKHEYAPAALWNHPNTFIAAGDINGDGRRDLVLSPSEREGHRYRISWFEAPADPRTNGWIEHVIVTNVETVVHFVGVADFDGDGRADVATAQMPQGADPDNVTVFLNRGIHSTNGWLDAWTPEIVSVDGSHAMRIVDVNGDGRPDLFGANWRENKRDEFVKLWVNQHPAVSPRRSSLDQWRRRVVDPAQPWPSVFIAPVDLDGDGRLDIVAGAWWYRNAGKTNAWERRTIGAPFNNFALAADFDGDKKPDLFGTAWIGKKADPRLVWARNDGDGKFTVLTNIGLPNGREDFLQGSAFGRYGHARPEITLSWHAGTGKGIQWLTIPENPTTEPWPWRRSAQADQQEQLTAADMDGDGKLDLVLGTRWLRNEGDAWEPHVIADNPLQPDRNRVGDINGDGSPDVVVGYLGISQPGRLAWYERTGDLTIAWREHIIAEDVVGPMSLDVADMDGDGDLDVVVGEHNLKDPAKARLIIFENQGRGESWRRHIVHTGDEHHDGAQIADIDGDGDLDIISIGWGHRQVLLYENLSIP